MSFISDLFGLGKQSMQDATQNNSTAANSQDSYNNSLISLFNAANQATALKNQMAVKNPAAFTSQSNLAGILKNTPTFNSKGGSAVTYSGPGDDAKASDTELQKQAISNLLAAPTQTPVPNSNTAAPVISKFSFDDYGPSTTYTPTTQS